MEAPDGAGPQHRVWEAIAASFDRTRRRPWAHVDAFVRGLPAGARVLDLMGGNGRHLAAMVEGGHAPIWVDWSRPAARIAVANARPAGTSARGHPVAALVADARALPLRDGCVDACVLAAGLHAVPSARDRASVLREMARVLRPGASAQVTVWSRSAPRFRGLAAGAAGGGQAGTDQAVDTVVPWRADGHDEPRTVHLHTAASLRDALTEAGLVDVEVRGLALAAAEPDNLVATCRRPEA